MTQEECSKRYNLLRPGLRKRASCPSAKYVVWRDSVMPERGGKQAAVLRLCQMASRSPLFQRPFGLPIPHTAIVPANQQRIGENL
jgi:hypothetical protein